MQHSATYSPEDNKLRLYFSHRIPRDEWDALRALGFAWCMKQAEAGGCDMAATWTPAREDAALDLAGEIGDEDQPRAERAADRAERFDGYADKREGEAIDKAEAYDAGPSIHAAQSEARAERAAKRHDRLAALASNQWSKAEYWTRRTAGVISHALYAERADVRHRRIKGLEADLRRQEKHDAEALANWTRWKDAEAIADPAAQDARARELANYCSHCYDYQHPTNPARRPSSLWSLMDPDQPTENRITGAQAVALYLSRHSDPRQRCNRWAEHYRLRLAYERQMLAAQGGTAADEVEMVAGGFVGKLQVQKVTKDRAGRVSKLYFYAPSRGKYDRKGNAYTEENPAPLTLHEYRAEKLAPGSYRAPTAEELAAFVAAKKAKAAAAPKGPPLLNPTPEDAAKLQAEWNARVIERRKESHKRQCLNPASAYLAEELAKLGAIAPAALTQAGYSARAAGSYGPCKTVDVAADWQECRRRGGVYLPCAFRVRILNTASDSLYSAPHVVVITDKKQSALPALVAPVAEGVELVAAR